VNTDAPDDWALYRAERRVLEIQTKLHRWAIEDPHRRFDDLFNLVTDPAFLLVAWDRVRSNRGARTAGADGKTSPTLRMGNRLVGILHGCLRHHTAYDEHTAWAHRQTTPNTQAA